MDLFIRYGGLNQFEQRILDPKLRSSAKAAISRFSASELIRNRQAAVNSAEANAKAKRLEADAEAYRVITEAKAEADAIRLVNEQLTGSPLYVDLVRAKRWDGVLPQTVLGEGVGAFISMPPGHPR